MAERMTFTLTGRDELSRVLNGTADSADRLRLRMSGITADADGRLRDIQGRFLTVDEAQRRLADTTAGTRAAFRSLSDETGRLGEALKANLISLAPAAIPATAGLAGSAAALAGQFGAVALAAGAYALALGPQIAKIGEASEAQKKYEDAVETSGATSQEAVKAQVEYQRQLAKLPPATREAAVAVGLLKDNYQEWSDALAGDVMAPFTKGIAVANALLPQTTGLVKGASAQFDRLITLVGGAISTPGFDALNDRVTDFAERTMRRGVDELTIFLAKLDSGKLDDSGLQQFFNYARENGPIVWDTLENVGEALLNVLEAGSGVGVGMLQVINALSGVVSAVPPEAIATFLQLAIAIKAVRLAAVGAGAAGAAMAALGLQVGVMTAAAAGAPSRLAAVTAAIGTLSRRAKLAMAGTGIGLLLIGLSELSARSQKPKPDVDKLATAITELGRSGKLGGEAVRAYGKDLAGLADSLQKVVDPEGLDQVQQSIVSFFGTDSTPVKNAKEDIDALDKALATLVSNGQADLAAAGLEKVIASLKKQGFTSKEVRDQLNDYKDALAGQALEQQLAAESMGLFGQQAQQTSAHLAEQKQSADGLRQAIQALNDVNRAAFDAETKFEAALDAATESIKTNGATLDASTEKGRANRSALSALGAATDDLAAKKREEGGSWSQVNRIYDRGRQKLIESAMQMGLTRQQAQRLANQILKTPDKTARLKGDMEDLQKKINRAKSQIKSVPPSKLSKMNGTIADLERKVAAAKARIKSVPPSKRSELRATIADLERKVRQARDALASVRSKTVTITAAYRNFRQGERDFTNRASGGRVRGYAAGGDVQAFPDGGLVQGPGTATSDSILALFGSGARGRVSNTEYVVNAAAVREYGVPFLDAVNSRLLKVGRAAAKAGLPAAPVPRAATSSERPPVTYNVYPRRSVISVEDLRLLQRQEEARQRVGRPR